MTAGTFAVLFAIGLATAGDDSSSPWIGTALLSALVIAVAAVMVTDNILPAPFVLLAAASGGILGHYIPYAKGWWGLDLEQYGNGEWYGTGFLWVNLFWGLSIAALLGFGIGTVEWLALKFFYDFRRRHRGQAPVQRQPEG